MVHVAAAAAAVCFKSRTVCTICPCVCLCIVFGAINSVQHEAAAKELGQVAIDADREFAAKEAAFRGKEAHLEDTLKAR